ncbi:MAG TPA: hypothetical protein PKE45_00535 [Caldilineaceae bacterium]|nr:hypothetical protein [Caldilineaceae bacterium]
MADGAEVCIANISPRERRKRLNAGLVMLAVSGALLAALVAFDAAWWWRLLLFPVLYGAAAGIFQWREKT